MKTIMTPDKQPVPAVVLVDSQGRVLTPGSVFDSTGTYTFDLPSLPKAYTYDGANNITTITYGPDLNGRRVVVTRTWAGALLQAESAPVLTGAAAAGLSLTGANSAVAGNQSGDITVTVTPPGSYFSPFTFTPSDGGAGGRFTPERVTLSYGQRAASFTYTPASEGVKTLSGNVDQGGLAVTAALSLTVSAPGKAAAPAQAVAAVDGTTLTLSWTPVPPEGNGGTPVREYLVKLASHTRRVDSTVSSVMFVGLEPGVQVTGSVAAVTDAGVGAFAVSNSATPYQGNQVVSPVVNGAPVGASAI